MMDEDNSDMPEYLLAKIASQPLKYYGKNMAPESLDCDLIENLVLKIARLEDQVAKLSFNLEDSNKSVNALTSTKI